MKKSLIIILLFVLVLLIVIPFILVFKKKSATNRKLIPQGSRSTNSASPTPVRTIPSSVLPTNIVLPTALLINPSASFITISGVQMNNFTKTAAQTNQEGDVLIVTAIDSYQLVYLARFQQFLISILGSPFETHRKIAEAAFTQSLGISQADACKLPVTVSTPRWVNPNEAGTHYPLSFCK